MILSKFTYTCQALTILFHKIKDIESTYLKVLWGLNEKLKGDVP